MYESESRPQLLSLTAISERTFLSRSAIYREINAGHLKTVKIGRAVRVTEAELGRYINSLEESPQTGQSTGTPSSLGDAPAPTSLATRGTISTQSEKAKEAR